MPVARIVFESESTEWETPPELFALLDAEFYFDLDPASTDANAKTQRHLTKAENGLARDWAGGSVWLNPPYGNTIGQWVRKAYETARAGTLVVCLLPARTDTRWWDAYVMEAAEIRFIKGRVKFVGGDSSAPFPSVVVVFRPGHEGLPIVRRLNIGDSALRQVLAAEKDGATQETLWR